MFVYDAEIIKAIQGKGESRVDGIEYCEGWHDYEGMGISVVCGYDYYTDRYRVFMEDNFEELRDVFREHPGPFVGFNNIGFDNRLLRANDIFPDDGRCYDILKEIWVSAGLAPEFQYPSHIGYGLDDVLQVNFNGLQKSGNGAQAPVLWQLKQYAQVVDYCLDDVRLTKKVLDEILKTGRLINPKGLGCVDYCLDDVRLTKEVLVLPRP